MALLAPLSCLPLPNLGHVRVSSRSKSNKAWEAAVDFAEWLCGLGLGQYAAAFAENAVNT